MHCEMFRYFKVFFVEIQLKKENLKIVFWEPEFGCPNQYTGLPNGPKYITEHSKGQEQKAQRNKLRQVTGI